MAREDLPPAWTALLASAGFTSARRLAQASGVGVDAVLRAMRGGQSSSTTLRQIAAALRVNIARIEELRGHPIPKPFELPEGAERLTDTQRDAIRTVVRAMLEPAAAESGDVVELRQVARRSSTPREGDSP